VKTRCPDRRRPHCEPPGRGAQERRLIFETDFIERLLNDGSAMSRNRKSFLAGTILVGIAVALLAGLKIQIRVTRMQRHGEPAQFFVEVGWPGHLPGHSLAGSGVRLEDVYECYGLKHVCFCGVSARTMVKQKAASGPKPAEKLPP